MIRIALVGDIGSGKSYFSKLFRFPIFDADLEVTKIYGKDKKFNKLIRKKFPQQTFSFPLKKEELIKCILSNSGNLKKISKIVHPIVKKKLGIFLKKNKNKKFVILDIPLYLENKLNSKNDVIVFVDASNKDIKSSLLKRKRFNNKLLRLFKKIQLPLLIKKKRSNFIIRNDFTTKTAKRSVRYILKQLRDERNNT
ncbi:dephospho-CoA kinase [Candidatus Pelagibacter sp.]|uniref:dephospho-CoA kinase n=1 Tax=Candidatus Pelagibacter sp. TaxID=2024849 RepID=UPI003F8495E5